MASITYPTPSLNHKDYSALNTFLKSIEDRMIEAGLIRIVPDDPTSDAVSSSILRDYNNSTFVAVTNAAGLSFGTPFLRPRYITSMAFRLPVGNNSVQYVNDSQFPEYKRITAASYDSTPVSIQLNFFYIHANNRNENNIGSQVLLATCRIYDNFNSRVIVQFSTGINLIGDVVPLNVSHNMRNSSYISLTNNTLSVAIGNHDISGMTANNNDFLRYLLCFNIYRNKGRVHVYGIPYEIHDSTTQTAYYRGNNVIRQASVENTSNTKQIFNQPNTNNNFLSWPFGTSVTDLSGGKIITGKVYAAHLDRLEVVPQFLLTRRVGTTVEMFTAVFKSGNNYCLGTFANLGLTEAAQRPFQNSLLYSWAFLHDDTITYTTSNVGP